MSRRRIWMSEYFFWFLVVAVPCAHLQPVNMTCKFTTTGQIFCLDIVQGEYALFEEARKFAACLVNNAQQSWPEDVTNETEGVLPEWLENFRCLVRITNMEQPKVIEPKNKDISQVPLRSYELHESIFRNSEDFNTSSCIVCFVAKFRDILIVRYNNSHCDDRYTCNANEARRTCEKFFDRYIKNCVNVTECLTQGCVKIFLDNNDVSICDIHSNKRKAFFPTIPIALKSKGEDTYFGIPFREVGGTSGFVILSAIYVTGLTLNCILIRIFIRHEEMRKDSKLIIINVAIADMLNLVLHSPPIDIFLVNSIHSPLSVTYVFYMIVGLNIYSVMMFSCHIYLTVLPVKNRRNSGCSFFRRYSPHAHALTAALIACLVPVPVITAIEEYHTVSLYVLIAYCAVPLCCSTLFSAGTSLQLGSCVQNVHCGSTDHEAVRAPRSESANTLVALVVVSAVSYVPYFCLPFIPPYIGEQSDDHPFLIPWVFVWFNSFMNPIALYVANRNFRCYFNKYMCFCCCGERE